MNRCLYKCETKDGKKLQSCMPTCGLVDLKDKATGHVVKLDKPYTVIKCKFPECL